jgi:hypothetical protein
MRFSRPGTGTILGAVFIALGGTAFAAGATVVNIADPTTRAHVARVNASGQLQTSGSTSVTNTVNTELAAPSTYVHAPAFNLMNSRACTLIAAPPTGKAMIAREVRINVSLDPSPGADQWVYIWDSASCTGSPVAGVNPATIGEATLPFDPGLGVPANSGLSVLVGGSVVAEAYTDGYSVASSLIPATGVTATRFKTQTAPAVTHDRRERRTGRVVTSPAISAARCVQRVANRAEDEQRIALRRRARHRAA